MSMEYRIYKLYFRSIKRIMQIKRNTAAPNSFHRPIRESLLHLAKCDTSHRSVARGNSITC